MTDALAVTKFVHFDGEGQWHATRVLRAKARLV